MKDNEPSKDLEEELSPPKVPAPKELKGALERTGRMLKSAGLPFEEDEFDDNNNLSSKPD